VGNVLVIGASNASGFGFNLGRAILLSHSENRVVLTAQKKRLDALREYVAAQGSDYDPSRVELAEFNVTEPTPIQHEVNHVVVCPAFMDPKFLKPTISYDQVDKAAKEESYKVVVEGFRNSVKSANILENGAVWGVSFAGHDFPGYNIGPIKKMLEDTITGEDVRPGVRQNVLSLGVFESVAGLGITGFENAEKIYDALGLKNPTLSAMVYGAVTVMTSPSLDRRIVNLDGGLREAMKTHQGREAYDRFIGTLRS
jgi:enoyl-[acyl-carrier-protein] reductase (NADH)